ncbi:serine hydrolase domain-containing protein [Novosphingobium sp. 9]|uniref:serine hydrolase domain-containing protein n=1 Tax=Novosphingobium sp. 9 TaxID=2025349 RepID=UPI0021B53114|nr:serine hydrolase [Novosphingobium sp. 9]
MPVRRPPLILCLALLPSLAACGQSGDAGPPPPSAEAEAALKGNGGAPHAALGRAIDALFDDGAVGHTDALVVMKRGEVIAERYASGIDAKTRLPGWSAGQCVTALMIGQLISDGRLRADESPPIPDWQRTGDPRGEITLRQLLQMRSGLRHSETAVPERHSDRFRMLFLDGRDDMAAYAEAQPLVAPVGKRFKPSSATSVILADLAARVLAEHPDPDSRRRAVNDYLRARVLEPIGMGSTVVGYDRAGTMVGAGMIHATARDWADLAEFLRHTGSVQGAQVLPRRWVEFMLLPSPANPGYGAGVWLNRAGSDGSSPLFPGKVSMNLFGCVGEYGQYVIGSPDQLLTVVRLGETGPDKAQALHDRLGDLIALFPSN